MESQLILKLSNINKTFPGVQALKGVDMDVRYGEVHCLVGENGSGKSTLIRIVSGVEPPESGTIIINGNSYERLTVRQAMREGIQVIYQDLSLFPDLPVGENIAFNWLMENSQWLVDRKAYLKRASEELERLDARIDLTEQVRNLSMSQKQIVAIARALVLDAKLLIFDEPTSALTKKEIDILLKTIEELKQRNITTVFVSHKLNEVFRIADIITVLRDGVKIGDFAANEIDENKLAYYMTGREIVYETFEPEVKNSQRVLELRSLTRKPHFSDINLSVSEGEIVGIIGPLGAGRTELALSLFGLNKPQSGEILFEDKSVHIGNPSRARELGVTLLPEDRHTQGLFKTKTVVDNLTAAILDRLKRFVLIDQTKAKEESSKIFSELRIKASSLETVVETLSGGNQQRVVLGKWLATTPKLFILDSPTVGIDVGSKSEIYEIIHELARNRMAVLMISDEIPEVYHNCNRVIVMRDGQITATLTTRDTTEEQLRNLVEGRT